VVATSPAEGIPLRIADLCEVRIQDYRQIPDGPYFDQIRNLLAPDGLLLNHGVVRTVAAPYDPDTLSMRYVFPAERNTARSGRAQARH